MVFRFPNPGSDLEKILRIFQLICQESVDKGIKRFDLDFMARVAASTFQASSRGAIGANAIVRSADSDRSRDPLYNSLKMYSEIYRNMGLLRPTEKRLEFCITNLGFSIAIDFAGDDIAQGIARECLLSMTFPNRNSESFGIDNLRPFRWLLMLIEGLDGVITRHEIILGLLDVRDDREMGLLDKKMKSIRKLRKMGWADLMNAVSEVSDRANIQKNTLENYTRFPIGVLSSSVTSWAEKKTFSNLYDRNMVGVELTDFGLKTARRMSQIVDLRSSDLENFQQTERASFAQFAYYSMLFRSGVRQDELEVEIEKSTISAKPLVTQFGIGSPDSFIYSPHLEESNEVLLLAESD